jgi:plastocyanin
MGERRRRWRGGIAATACTLVLSACGAAAASPAPTTSTGTGTVPPSAEATFLATAAASAAPELSSTTVRATSAPDGAVTVEMTGPPPHYVPRAVTAKAGEVVFFLDNTSLQGIHTLAIDRAPLVFANDRVTNTPLAVSDKVIYRQAATFTVEGLKAGTYFIWCTIDNHAREGMTGTLTVNP